MVVVFQVGGALVGVNRDQSGCKVPQYRWDDLVFVTFFYTLESTNLQPHAEQNAAWGRYDMHFLLTLLSTRLNETYGFMCVFMCTKRYTFAQHRLLPAVIATYAVWHRLTRNHPLWQWKQRVVNITQMCHRHLSVELNRNLQDFWIISTYTYLSKAQFT